MIRPLADSVRIVGLGAAGGEQAMDAQHKITIDEVVLDSDTGLAITAEQLAAARPPARAPEIRHRGRLADALG
jgi:hypothetical protein